MRGRVWWSTKSRVSETRVGDSSGPTLSGERLSGHCKKKKNCSIRNKLISVSCLYIDFFSLCFCSALVSRALIENPNLIKWSLLSKAFSGLFALICGNGYIVGINQIYDIGIDKYAVQSRYITCSNFPNLYFSPNKKTVWYTKKKTLDMNFFFTVWFWILALDINPNKAVGVIE